MRLRRKELRSLLNRIDTAPYDYNITLSILFWLLDIIIVMCRLLEVSLQVLIICLTINLLLLNNSPNTMSHNSKYYRKSIKRLRVSDDVSAISKFFKPVSVTVQKNDVYGMMNQWLNWWGWWKLPNYEHIILNYIFQKQRPELVYKI